MEEDKIKSLQATWVKAFVFQDGKGMSMFRTQGASRWKTWERDGWRKNIKKE